MERHSLYGATYGATLAIYMSDIRYICIKRSSLHWRYGATLATWQMHTHAHFFAFPQCTIGNQVLSTSTRSASNEIHATALGSGVQIGNSNGDRQIVFGEKIPRQTRSVAPPKRLRLFFWI